MTDSDKKGHWQFLGNLLGAKPDEKVLAELSSASTADSESEEVANPAAPPKPLRSKKTEKKTPASPPSSRNWGSIASALGLSTDQPEQPTTTATSPEPTHEETESEVIAESPGMFATEEMVQPPAEAATIGDAMADSSEPDQMSDDPLANWGRRPQVVKAKADVPKPLAELFKPSEEFAEKIDEDQTVRRMVDDVDIAFQDGRVDSEDRAERHTDDERSERRPRRRRGRGRGRDEIDLRRDDDDARSSRPRADEHDDVEKTVSADGTDAVEADDEDRSSERPRRRRRRRGRGGRGGRQREVASEDRPVIADSIDDELDMDAGLVDDVDDLDLVDDLELVDELDDDIDDDIDVLDDDLDDVISIDLDDDLETDIDAELDTADTGSDSGSVDAKRRPRRRRRRGGRQRRAEPDVDRSDIDTELDVDEVDDEVDDEGLQSVRRRGRHDKDLEDRPAGPADKRSRRRPTASDEDEDRPAARQRKNVPSWQDAIDSVVEHNLANRKNQRSGGPGRGRGRGRSSGGRNRDDRPSR